MKPVSIRAAPKPRQLPWVGRDSKIPNLDGIRKQFVDDMKRIGKLAFRSILYFEIATTLALVVGLAALVTWLLVGALEQTFWQRVP